MQESPSNNLSTNDDHNPYTQLIIGETATPSRSIEDDGGILPTYELYKIQDRSCKFCYESLDVILRQNSTSTGFDIKKKKKKKKKLEKKKNGSSN